MNILVQMKKLHLCVNLHEIDISLSSFNKILIFLSIELFDLKIHEPFREITHENL
jgi:hypothetical protein